MQMLRFPYLLLHFEFQSSNCATSNRRAPKSAEQVICSALKPKTFRKLNDPIGSFVNGRRTKIDANTAYVLKFRKLKNLMDLIVND